MNPQLFRHGATATILNAAGGKAYVASDKHTLTQYALTGCLNDTYYASAETQFDTILALAQRADVIYLAQLAVYARQEGYMKDLPAVLLGVLFTRASWLAKKVFNSVITNPKMLKNFVTVMRSGAVGRKSLGTAARNCVRAWLESRDESALLRGIMGGDVTLRDVIRLAHPKSTTPERAAFYRYVLGFDNVDLSLLPEEAQAFEAFKKDPSGAPPNVPFQLLSNVTMSADQWRVVAGNMSWQTLRMNLNTLQRNGCFEDASFVTEVAKRLADPVEVSKSECFPFQLLAAFKSIKDVPREISNALQDAMEHATKNIPTFAGKTVVGVDVSGSMSSAVTGNRKGATSTIRAIDAAALFASAILRVNPTAEVYPFDTRVYNPNLNGRDSVMTNTQILAKFGGGGTDCSLVPSALSYYQQTADTVILISDNESWITPIDYRGRGTALMMAWENFKKTNPAAKLVCIDLCPNTGLQAVSRKDILNVGGFSDQVFDVVAAFTKGELTAEHLVGIVRKVEV